MSIDRRQLIAASLAAAAAAALPPPAMAQSRRDRGPLEVRNPQTLTGLRQAVLGSIVCAYFTERRDRSHAGGGFSLMRRADVATISNLNNITDADFIAATDGVYAALLERLAAAGVTLADRSALAQATMRATSRSRRGRSARRIPGATTAPTSACSHRLRWALGR